MTRLALCALLLALLTPACGGGGPAAPPPGPPYDPGPWMQTLMLPMSDGTRLATDIYAPAGEGPWPVLLIRTPYEKQWDAPYAYEANADGIAVVVQDMRGRFDSEGENVPLSGSDLGEHQDGSDTISWIHAQEWCNGRIGTVGGSMLGMTQNITATQRPPGLVSQFVGIATASMFHEFVYHGGAFRQEQMVQWLADNEFDPAALALYHAHPTYDDFWRQFSIREHAAEITAPGLHFGGWFDTFCQGSIDGFLLRQHEGGSGAAGNQWLVMGPWVHGGEGETVCGEIEFPWDSIHVPDLAYVNFTDYYVRGITNDFPARPAVTYYVMGACGEPGAPGNEWRYADDWPIPASDTEYYLHGDGTLSTALPAGEEQSGWTFDPADPCPTVGGRNLMIDKGVFDQRQIEARADVLTFSTAPLAAPLEVTGRVLCRFWVSCDAVDTDVAVRLCDVYPDGRSLLIADGILRLRYRDSMESTTPLIPGQIYRVDVDLWSTSIIFNAGHRVRLSVTGSNHPRWDLNPGSGARWEDGGAYVVQHTTLYHGPARPSALLLPVVK